MTNPQTRSISVFLRRVGGRTLIFACRGSALTDLETGTTWHAQRGTALSGPLKGELIKALSYTPAFEYAWRNFYPATTWYRAP